MFGAMLWAAADAGARQAGANTAAGGLVSLDDVGAGTLLFKTRRASRYVAAPTVATEINMRVGGMVARVEVRQTFHNPSQSWLEGVYAFPLPENAAVDGMRIAFGDKVIDAVIAEKAAARQTYDKARKEGRKAALVEQQRPNLFTNDVANIGPGESITVTLRYQQTLRYDQGRFRLRFPMVAGPRYTPARQTVSSAGKDGWSRAAEIAADAERISSPVLRPEEGPVNPVALRIALDAGFPLAELHSPYHTIAGTDWRDGTATITLDAGAVPADRDFELVWKPDTGAAPVAGVFRETVDGKDHVLIMVLPPHRGRVTVAPIPRDLIFVLDRSGSMGGTSIIQAREATKAALARLRTTDRFEIIRFSSGHDALFGAVRHATPAHISRANAFVSATTANGGTQMLAPLRRALDGRAERGRLRQIVFLTDGGVSNESRLLAEIDSRLGRSRLFTVGIGSPS
jgi:Ca-activated chloride channel family protein